jgi:protein SCO1
MTRFQKVGILFVTLMVPALSYIGLRAFTENHYSLPRFIPVIDSIKNTPQVRVVIDADGNRHQDTVYRTVPAFNLIDQDGQKATRVLIDKKIHIADFFFTRCGTICPKIQSNLTRVQEVFEYNPDVVLVSYSIDPENDKPEQLKLYAKRYGAIMGKWHFLTGDKAQIYALAQRGYFLPVVDHGVSYGKPDETFIHSEKLVLVDKEGVIRGFYDGTDKEDVERLIAEIRVLLDIYKKAS